ncbi:MAG: heavy-metal-associated domain-containing protein [Angelakisella sp.]|nr:heavy-metal-associated domain-containing protein [Angelakisella sp.]
MRKSYKLIDLDCANCAAKMEDGIRRIDGVLSATVSFMSQKLTIETEDGRMDEVMQEVVRVCKKVEPDCQIVLK